jgi:hypothetical protein
VMVVWNFWIWLQSGLGLSGLTGSHRLDPRRLELRKKQTVPALISAMRLSP